MKAAPHEWICAVALLQLRRRQLFQLAVIFIVRLFDPRIVILQLFISILLEEIPESLNPGLVNLAFISDGLVELPDLVLVGLRPRNRSVLSFEFSALFLEFVDCLIKRIPGIDIRLIFLLDIIGQAAVIF